MPLVVLSQYISSYKCNYNIRWGAHHIAVVLNYFNIVVRTFTRHGHAILRPGGVLARPQTFPKSRRPFHKRFGGCTYRRSSELEIWSRHIIIRTTAAASRVQRKKKPHSYYDLWIRSSSESVLIVIINSYCTASPLMNTCNAAVDRYAPGHNIDIVTDGLLVSNLGSVVKTQRDQYHR